MKYALHGMENFKDILDVLDIIVRIDNIEINDTLTEKIESVQLHTRNSRLRIVLEGSSIFDIFAYDFAEWCKHNITKLSVQDKLTFLTLFMNNQTRNGSMIKYLAEIIEMSCTDLSDLDVQLSLSIMYLRRNTLLTTDVYKKGKVICRYSVDDTVCLVENEKTGLVLQIEKVRKDVNIYVDSLMYDEVLDITVMSFDLDADNREECVVVRGNNLTQPLGVLVTKPENVNRLKILVQWKSEEEEYYI